MRRFRKGQSTLEYVIILAAVVGAIIAAAAALKTKLGATGGVYDTLGDELETKVDCVTF